MLDFLKFFRNSLVGIVAYGIIPYYLLKYFGLIKPFKYYIFKYDPNDRLGLIKTFNLEMKAKGKAE